MGVLFVCKCQVRCILTNEKIVEKIYFHITELYTISFFFKEILFLRRWFTFYLLGVNAVRYIFVIFINLWSIQLFYFIETANVPSLQRSWWETLLSFLKKGDTSKIIKDFPRPFLHYLRFNKRTCTLYNIHTLLYKVKSSSQILVYRFRLFDIILYVYFDYYFAKGIWWQT